MSISFNLFKALESITRKPPLKNETYLTEKGNEEELDQTGRVASGPRKKEIICDKSHDLIFANFDNSIAHSYWRMQELSLFNRAKKSFVGPVLDFGCGDGAFSACIFEQIDIGVDIDQKALKNAEGYGVYDNLITFEDMVNTIEDGSIGTVFSCSVLEHTTRLRDCIKQIARVLQPGGKFYFSSPNKNFTVQMVSLVDEDFAKHMNTRMYHRNLLSHSEWEQLLNEHGLVIETFINFQPLEYTRKYFSLSLMGNRGFGMIPGLRSLYLKLSMRPMFREAAMSIDGTVKSGANYFVVVSKIIA